MPIRRISIPLFHSFYLEGNDKNTQYTLNDIDFGLVERPKAGLELSKKVNNVKLKVVGYYDSLYTEKLLTNNNTIKY